MATDLSRQPLRRSPLVAALCVRLTTQRGWVQHSKLKWGGTIRKDGRRLNGRRVKKGLSGIDELTHE